MYILRQSFIEICKTFLTSIVCSVVFALMIYRESALPNSFIAFVLNGSAFLLFLYINCLNWVRLYRRTYSIAEFYIPAIVAVLVYAAITAFAYSQRYSYYMWLFLPTRFLEPKLNSSYATLSVFVTHFSMLVLVLLTPVLSYRRR